VRPWLNSPDRQENPEEFSRRCESVSQTYLAAQALHEQGVHVVSTDEKTGIQAIERDAPALSMRPGLPEKQEFNYDRHGTLCLTANLDVATGKIVTPTLGPTRGEEDFAAHVRQTIAADPEAQWILICDQLNTHQSEALVRLVAGQCARGQELGIKGESGVLQSLATRRAFLEDPSHRVRFLYTPRHASWMNQIEIWFGFLVRRALRRASFASVEQLRQRLLAFIDYFNRTMAKPFRWTYKGRPLTA
jgi:hypothetical protein